MQLSKRKRDGRIGGHQCSLQGQRMVGHMGR